MTLEFLKILVKVIESGSFTAAAERLGVPRSYVSRVMAQLEAQLGVVLVERTTRTRSITEAGREVYERAVGILAACDDITRVTQRIQDAPSGLLRLTCGVEFGMVMLNAWIEDFLALYPDMSVETEYTSRELDLVHEGFDLAIRVGPLPASRLVAKRLGQFSYGLFASPDYLKAHGIPHTPEQLAAHRLVMFSGAGPRQTLLLQHPRQREILQVPIQSRLRVNTGMSVRSAIVRGLGIGPLPWAMVGNLINEGALVNVLAPWHPPSVDVYAVYPGNRYLTPKVRAFVDLVAAGFPQLTQAGQ